MKALKNRQTNREFGEGKISQQVLSNLLWAACGINRPEAKKRTAPSAMNYQEVDVYVITAEGVCIMMPKNMPSSRSPKKIYGPARAPSPLSQQPRWTWYLWPIIRKWPGRMRRTGDPRHGRCSLHQRKYLSFLRFRGLNTGVRASIDKEACAKALQLKENQHIMLGHSVGYRKRSKGPELHTGSIRSVLPRSSRAEPPSGTGGQTPAPESSTRSARTLQSLRSYSLRKTIVFQQILKIPVLNSD